MAPSSPSFLDRLSLSHKGPLLPLHSSRNQQESEYDLDELEPQSTDGLLPIQGPELIHRRNAHRASGSRIPESSIGDADNEESPRQRPPSTLFAGPPPPIARSAFLVKDDVRDTSPPPRHTQHQPSHQNVASSLLNIGSVFFDSRRDKQQTQYQPQPDSIWQSLRRRERAIEDDLQHVLDMQAAALAGELGPAASPPAVE